MRVLHLVHQYLPDKLGGTELYTNWLAEALERRGHEVSIFYRRQLQDEGLSHRTERNIQIWSAWSGEQGPTQRFLATISDKEMVANFEQVLNHSQPDLVHVQHLMGHPAALIKRISERNIPFVITLHDFWWVCANAQLLTNYSQEVCGGPKMYLNCARCGLARAGYSQFWPILPFVMIPLSWRNWSLRKILDQANALITSTKFVRDWYKAIGVPSAKLVTLTPGVDTPAPVDQTPRLPAAPIRFGYIGGISVGKGIHLLLEAVNEIDAEYEVWIGGDESADPDYVSTLKALATERVQFVGKLDRPAVWEMLAQIDVLVVPSIWYETFVFVISEAFAAGVPVVTSRLGPMADRVRHEVDGLLVEPNDVRSLRHALQRLCHSPELLGKLRSGIGPVKTFDDFALEIETLPS